MPFPRFWRLPWLHLLPGALGLGLMGGQVPVLAAPVAGGSLSGRVVFRGRIPRLPGKKVVSQTEICGVDPKPEEALLVGEEKGLGNVVVSLEGKGLRKGSPPQTVKPVLDQVKCVFTPHVLLVRSGQPFLIRNSDPTLHNAHGFAVDGRYSLFNVGIGPGGPEQEVVERSTGGIAIRCDAGHTWMLSFLYVTPNAFAAVTPADGSFLIEGVPPGRYQLVIWHEYLGKQTQSVVIEEGQVRSLFVMANLLEKPLLRVVDVLPEQADPSDPESEWEANLIRSGIRSGLSPLEEVR